MTTPTTTTIPSPASAFTGTAHRTGRRLDAWLPTVGAGERVPLVDGGWVRRVDLDHAATTPALQAVADHVASVLPHYASVHRGAGYDSQIASRLYESARHEVARFVGARADDVVVFTRNTTDALNLLAGATPGEAVVLDAEHHANLLPWQRHGARIVPVASTLVATLRAVEAELRRAPAAVLAVTGASNVTGEVLPLLELAELARAQGARIVVDAAQLLPHRSLDLELTGIDYVAFSGHKLYAPFGAGALVGRRDWLDRAEPYLAGGGAVTQVTVAETAWAPAPARHEGGTPNLIGAAALAAACRELTRAGRAGAADHEQALLEDLLGGLRGLGLRPLRIWPRSADAADAADAAGTVGVVGFTVPGFPARQVSAYLSAEHGIAVRDGRFCAHPLLERLGCTDGAVRVSLGAASSTDDVDRLLSALTSLLTEGPRWTYCDTGATCAPTPDLRPAPDWLPDEATTVTDPCAPSAHPTRSTTTPGDHR